MNNAKISNQHLSTLESMIVDFETMRDEMQDSFDAKSEKWQESEKGEALTEKIDQIENLISELESAKSTLEDIVGSYED